MNALDGSSPTNQLARAVALTATASLVAAIAATSGFTWILTGKWPWTATIPSVELAEAAKLGLAVAAGLGGVVALVVAFRKQRLAENSAEMEGVLSFVQRFGSAAQQLGSESSVVRLAGVYAMSEVADQYSQYRQQCIDVLCSFLRLNERTTATTTESLDSEPLEAEPGHKMIPHPAENSEAAHSDGEVRRTIARVLGEHLMGSGSTPSWSEFNFDLRGALFHDLSLEGAHFTGGSVIFDNAVFTGRLTSFKGVHFSCDLASFDFAEFKAGTTLFEGAVFDSKSLRFGGTTFLGDSTVFDSAYFKSDAAWFGGTEFRSRVTSFTKTTYSGGGVHFAGSTFGSPLTVFSDATFGGTVTFFGSAQFLGKSVTFEGVNWESRVELHDIIVSKETLIEGLAPLVELGGYQYLEDGPRHFRSGAPSATSQQ